MATHSSMSMKNPMDGGAYYVAVHGITKSRTVTERLHIHFSLSWIGEGNGNPLQCSCLDNPMDRGAWWAAVCGVAQSHTRLKRLSSSSSSSSRRSLLVIYFKYSSVYISNLKLPIYPSPSPFSPDDHKFVLYDSVSVL